MTVTPKRNSAVQLSAIPAAIARAGFSPGKMTLLAAGRFENEHDKTTFRIRGWPHTYPFQGEVHPVEAEQEIHVVVDYSGTPTRFRQSARKQDAKKTPD